MKIFIIFLLIGNLYATFKLFSPIPPVEVHINTITYLNLIPYITENKKIEVKIKNNKYTKIICRSGHISIEPTVTEQELDMPELELKNPAGKVISISIPIKIKKQKLTKFTYRAPRGTKNVYLAGEFNSWNFKSTPMLDEDKNFVFEVSLPLLPGRYQYKFVVDGKWINDPENPNLAPDGFGGFNSVIEVKKPLVGNFISKYKEINFIDDKASFELLYNGETELKKIYVLINNTPVNFTYQKNKLTIQLENITAYGDYITGNIISIDSNKNFVEYTFKEKTHKDAPFDWRDAIIYFLLIDRFNNADESNDKPVDDEELHHLANYLGGDIKGIIQKIQDGYFKKIGINTIWISPFYDNPEHTHRDALPPHRKFTGYHGYWPKDFYKVEEKFGSEEDLIQLVKTAHKNNIKIMFDMVTNHLHIDSTIYTQHPQWFSSLDLGYGRKNIRLFDERPIDTWFDEFLPDINFENKQAIDFVVEHCIYWLKKTDADAFRLDAVKHVPHEFWKELRKRIKEEIEIPNNKKIYLLGETISSREKIMEWVNIEELDGQLDFPLYWPIRDAFALENISLLHLEKERERSQTLYKDNPLMPVFIGTHDFARFLSYADGDVKPGTDEKSIGFREKIKVNKKDSYKKLKLAFTFILTLSQIPVIYYGDEIGLTGAGDPDNRRPMKFKNLTIDEKSVLEHVSKLTNLRKENEAVKYGDFIPIITETNLYAYLKKYFQQEVIVIINRNNSPVELKLNLPFYSESDQFLEIFTNKMYKTKGKTLRLKIPAKTSYVFKTTV